MKSLFRGIMLALLFALVALLWTPKARAADLSYSTLTPQTGDTDLQIAHKGAIATAPRLWTNLTTSGTFTVAAATLDRVIVGTSGTTSQVVLKDGTNTIATATTTTQIALPFSLALSSGTLTAITTGGAPANLTITYR
jgi:hypothetical protein